MPICLFLFVTPEICHISGTFIIGGTDEIQTILDDQIVKIQAMNASPFVKPFKERASNWEQTLQTLQVQSEVKKSGS